MQLRGRDFLIEKLKHRLELRLEEEEIGRAAETPVEDHAAEAPEPDKAKRHPTRQPLPSHLPRNETVLVPGDACRACGGRLKHMGEDVTEELDYVPCRFIVNGIVRPRMACTFCEKIQQAP